jgi:O-antigen/teichoic acid export membrane protein
MNLKFEKLGGLGAKLGERAQLVQSLFQIRAFDTSSAAGRSRERLRRIALTATTAALARGIAMLAPLITVPLTLNYLGSERYGLWMTATSVVGMFVFADLGLGNGLLTAVSNANGRDDPGEIRRCIASTFFVLTVVAGVIAIVFPLLNLCLPWGRILHIQTTALIRESGSVVAICVLGFAVNLPLGVVQRTQLGLQQGFQSNLWQCGASFLNLILIVVAVHMKVGLTLLVLFATVVQPSIATLNGLAFFGLKQRNLIPRFADVHWPTARRLIKQGFFFFLLSIIMAIGIYSDNVVVAHVLGLDAVTLLSVPSRLAAILSMVASMIYLPLWTANGEAFARGDIDWVRRNTYRVLKLNLFVVTFAGLVFALAGPPVMHLWIGKDFNPGLSVFVGMATWALLTSTAGPLFMVLNARGTILFQVKLFGVFALISIALKIILTKSIGVSGAVWASVIPYALIVLPLTALRVKRELTWLDDKRMQESRGIDHTAVLPPAGS